MFKQTKQKKVARKRGNKRSSGEPQGVKIAQAIVRVTKGLFIGIGATVSVWLVLWIYTALTMHPYLEIKSIEVRGGKRLSAEEVVIVSGINSGDNIITVDIASSTKNIVSNSFIKKAEVKRILPDKVIIEIEEHVPVAFIMTSGRSQSTSGLYVMGSDGEMFKKFSVTDNLDLPVVTGLEKVSDEDGQLKTMALDFIRTATEVDGLAVEEISELHVDSVYGLTVYTTSSSVKLLVGSGDYDKKITNFKTFLDSREFGLRGVKSVDLDNDRGIIVDFKDGSGSEA